MNNVQRNGMNYWEGRLWEKDHAGGRVPELGVPYQVGNLIVTVTSDPTHPMKEDGMRFETGT